MLWCLWVSELPSYNRRWQLPCFGLFSSFHAIFGARRSHPMIRPCTVVYAITCCEPAQMTANPLQGAATMTARLTAMTNAIRKRYFTLHLKKWTSLVWLIILRLIFLIVKCACMWRGTVHRDSEQPSRILTTATQSWRARRKWRLTNCNKCWMLQPVWSAGTHKFDRGLSRLLHTELH